MVVVGNHREVSCGKTEAAHRIPALNLSPAMVRRAWITALAIAAVSLAYRTAYVVDCRRSGGPVEPCWTRGPLVLTLNVDDVVKIAGALGVGGWLGFNTYNPSLRDPRAGRRPDPPPPP
jgi:hypothetical protein